MKLTLCVERPAYEAVGINLGTTGIQKGDIGSIDKDFVSYMERSIVDGEETISIGQEFPHVIVYASVSSEGKYLTYARKGTEERLHGKRSLGFGGHVDPEDEILTDSIAATLINSAERELIEELGLEDIQLSPDMLNTAIVDVRDEVGTVHVGVYIHLELKPFQKLDIDKTEIRDPIWMTKEELLAQVDNFEGWSELVIKSL